MIATTNHTKDEKDFEAFFTENETLDMKRFENIDIIKNEAAFDEEKLEMFIAVPQN